MNTAGQYTKYKRIPTIFPHGLTSHPAFRRCSKLFGENYSYFRLQSAKNNYAQKRVGKAGTWLSNTLIDGKVISWWLMADFPTVSTSSKSTEGAGVRRTGGEVIDLVRKLLSVGSNHPEAGQKQTSFLCVCGWKGGSCHNLLST